MIKNETGFMSDDIEWIVAGTVSVAGWFAAFALNWYLQNRNLRALSKEKTYHRLMKAIADVQTKCDTLFDLITAMDVRIEIIHETTKVEPPRNLLSDNSPLNQIKIPPKLWNVFLDDYSESYKHLTASMIALVEDFGIWLYTFPKLETAIREFRKEGSELSSKIFKYYIELEQLDFNDLDSRAIRDCNKKARKLAAELATYMGFLHDLRVVLNNELLSSVHGYVREERSTPFGYFKAYKLDSGKKLKVLTLSGVVQKSEKS